MESNTSSSAPLPSRMEIRQIPQHGVTIDGVWVPWEFLEDLSGQGPYDSMAGPGGALSPPSREVERVLEARGLLERETRGGVHRGAALREWMEEVDFPVSNTSSTPSVSGPPEASPRPYRTFSVLGWMDERLEPKIEVRCWVCGVMERFGRSGLAPGLEEMAAWAGAHVCARMRVPDVRTGGGV